jgi:hypothetical protein
MAYDPIRKEPAISSVFYYHLCPLQDLKTLNEMYLMSRDYKADMANETRRLESSCQSYVKRKSMQKEVRQVNGTRYTSRGEAHVAT